MSPLKDLIWLIDQMPVRPSSLDESLSIRSGQLTFLPVRASDATQM